MSRQQRQKPTERTDPRARLAALALLDRAVAAATDDELVAMAGGLTDDQRAEFDRLLGPGGPDDLPAAVRATVQRGRINGVAEAVAMLLSDRALADCIEQLGDAADLPSADDLHGVLPGLLERHGVGAVRLMFAAAVCGEAPASPALVQLLRHDEHLALPPVTRDAPAPRAGLTAEELADRERVKAARAERKEREKQAAAARRAQAQQARRR